jgi:hypothetical protein
MSPSSCCASVESILGEGLRSRINSKLIIVIGM